jgi:hypothetical protein
MVKGAMISSALIAALCVVTPHVLLAQQHAAADTVMLLRPGTGQNAGQGPAFFPRNVLGIPDPRASDSTPSTDPREVCSIGLGGELIIGFKNAVVVDGPGIDLVIFENAFRYGRGRIYAEPARIELSLDGVVWHRVPFDSATLNGCAGVTPTSGRDPFDPTVSGGDGVDLAELGLDSIRWVKLVDVTSIILNDPSHAFYDPTLSGADIDAVVGIHTVDAPRATTMIARPRSTIIDIAISSTMATFLVHDVAGRLLYSEELLHGLHSRDVADLVVTTCFVTLASTDNVQTLKVLR